MSKHALWIICRWAVSRHITCCRRNKEALWDHHFIFRVPGPVDHAFTTLHGEVDVGHHRYCRKSLDAGDCVHKEREKLVPLRHESSPFSCDFSLSAILEIQSSRKSTLWICSASQSENEQYTHSLIPLDPNINQSHWCIWYGRAKRISVLPPRYGKSLIYWLAPLVWIRHPLYSSGWS